MAMARLIGRSFWGFVCSDGAEVGEMLVLVVHGKVMFDSGRSRSHRGECVGLFRRFFVPLP